MAKFIDVDAIINGVSARHTLNIEYIIDIYSDPKNTNQTIILANRISSTHLYYIDEIYSDFSTRLSRLI